MPTNRIRRTRVRAGKKALTPDDLTYLTWMKLDGSTTKLDQDPEAAERAYFANRARILGADAYPGGRPWSFWQFELKEPQPLQRWRERARLRELGLLAKDEIEALAKIEVVARGQGLMGPFDDPSRAQH